MTMLTVGSLFVFGHIYIFGLPPNSSLTINPSLNQPMPNSTELPAITESPTQLMPPTTPAPRLRSDYTYTPGVGAHKVYKIKLNWNDARLYCEKEGAHLLIINSRAEMEAIKKLFANSQIWIGWMGAHEFYKEGQFVTIHGESLETAGFAEWDSGQPNNLEGDEDCVMVTVQNEVCSLHDYGCTTVADFTCELPMPNSTELPAITESPTQLMPPTTPAPRLRSDYTYTPGVGAHKVYRIELNWNDARLYCEKEGAHLVIINSCAEMEAIKKLCANSGVRFSWIGAHDFYKEGQFVTIHGESLETAGFAEWHAGEPNNFGGDEDCVYVAVQNKVSSLYDHGCTKVRDFTCELPL